MIIYLQNLRSQALIINRLFPEDQPPDSYDSQKTRYSNCLTDNYTAIPSKAKGHYRPIPILLQHLMLLIPFGFSLLPLSHNFPSTQQVHSQ